MEIDEYLNRIRKLQQRVLSYISDQKDVEEEFSLLTQIIDEQNLKNDIQELQIFLNLITNVSNHQRTHNFFHKLERILLLLKFDIKHSFSNFQIFQIFKKSKRILLFLFKEKILEVDEKIVNFMFNKKKYLRARYSYYFYPEIRSFLPEKRRIELEQKIRMIEKRNSASFEDMRTRGENEEYIAQLIREDSKDDFFNYLLQGIFKISDKLDSSIFETNLFLCQNPPTLIEYAAFFGAKEIFKFLFNQNKVKVSPQIWLYAVHSNNVDFLELLTKTQIKPPDDSYRSTFIESIKCHLLDISAHITINLLDDDLENNYNVYSNSFKYYNFAYLPNDLSTKFAFFYACKYNYVSIVEILLKKGNIDINDGIILEYIYF